MNKSPTLDRSRLVTPPAAAVAGILFSVLLITSLLLIRLSVPSNPLQAGNFLSKSYRKIDLGLNLVPFAGIAFLWFIGVVRDRLGEQEDRLFATVFMGSGLLFLAMLFASAAFAGGVIDIFGSAAPITTSANVYTFGRSITYQIMNVYAMKMAGVFMVSTSTLSLRTGILPRWMAFLGLLLAAFLIFSLGFFFWAPLIFPVWVLMISVYILRANLQKPKVEAESYGTGS